MSFAQPNPPWQKNGHAMLAAMLALCLPLAALADEKPKTIEDKIRALLAEAANAATLDTAEQKLAAAANLLPKNTPPDQILLWGFLEADLIQTSGRVYAASVRRDSTDLESARRAIALYQQAHQKYEMLQHLAEEQVDRHEQQENNIEKLKKQRRYQMLIGYISRADYGLAWTDYDLAQLIDDQNYRNALLLRAEEKFMAFTADGYRNHPIVANSFWGRALCLYGRKHFFEVTQLLDPDIIAPENTYPEFYKKTVLLRIQAFRAMGSNLQAENAAAWFFDSLNQDHQLDSLELQIAIEWIQCLANLVNQQDKNPFYQTHLQRLKQISERVYACGGPWRAKLAEIFGESSPLNQLVQAEHFFSRHDYASAVELVKAALSQAAGDPSYAAKDLRYIMAVGYWNMAQWRQAFYAGREFLDHDPDDPRAPDLSYLTLQAAVKSMGTSSPAETQDILTMIQQVKTRFAAHPDAPRLAWYRAAVLLKSQQPQAALDTLKSVTPDSPIYLHALYGRAMAYSLQSKTTQTEPSNPTRTAVLLESIHNELVQFSNTIKKNPDEESRTFVHPMAMIAMDGVQAYLDLADRTDTATWRTKAGEMLDLAESLKKYGLSDPTVFRIRSLRLETDLYLNRLIPACQTIDELLDRPEIKFDLSQNDKPSDQNNIDLRTASIRGFIVASNILEQHVRQLESRREENVTTDELKTQAARLVKINQFLLRRLTPDSSSPDRRNTVRQRLADNLVRIGDDAQAVNYYQTLIQQSKPQSSGQAVRGLAIACEHLGQYQTALDQWRILADALPQRSDHWIEARYHMIRCYHHMDRNEQARTLLDYFFLLCPKDCQSHWQKQFELLDQAVGHRRTADLHSNRQVSP